MGIVEALPYTGCKHCLTVDAPSLPPLRPRSKRLRRFFETLYALLTRGARAVLQVYPENSQQAEMMVAAAMKVRGRGGGRHG